MPYRRIIPCLDMKDGRVVKGVKFEGLVDAGDPAELAARYDQEGADEICFLDITATDEGRETLYHVVERTADRIRVPLTVGGGVRTLDDVRRMLEHGADKVSVNSAAVRDPSLVNRIADAVGAQCLVVAIDAKGGEVYVRGGREPTGLDAVAWAREVATRGAGEILLTSMDRDGTRSGYDLGLLRRVVDAVSVPVIASGGVGTLDHLHEGLEVGGADAVLAASIFHFGDWTVSAARQALAARGAHVRPHPSTQATGTIAQSRGTPMSSPTEIETLWNQTRPDRDGLVACVAQDLRTKAVLMVAWVSKVALERTVETGQAWYWSRSRGELWQKGATSGHTQRVVEVRLDCDGDTLLYLVEANLPACHEGTDTCFSRKLEAGVWHRSPRPAQGSGESVLSDLEAVIRARASASATSPPSYTRTLLEGGVTKQVAKIKEESEELAVALAKETDDRVVSETADVLYHVAVALRGRGLGFDPVFAELARRFSRSGLEEKASRPPKPEEPPKMNENS